MSFWRNLSHLDATKCEIIFKQSDLKKKPAPPDHKLQPDAIAVTGDQQRHSTLSQLISCVLRNGNQ